MKQTKKRNTKCFICGKDATERLWCGRMLESDGRITPDQTRGAERYKEDYVCGRICFLRALVKYAPLPETRNGAQRALLEVPQ
ncbi:MAG: hypothetical protein C5B59_12355 [Bacteroidetes bacterium]|nr:MAG: hypothetical protein C5B59_12355 [Bacteroidota bacterium]